MVEKISEKYGYITAYKRMLKDTDYIILKEIEGYDIPDIETIKAKRKFWRDEINKLEQEE